MCDNNKSDSKKNCDDNIPNSKCRAQKRLLDLKRQLLQTQEQKKKKIAQSNSSSSNKTLDKYEEFKSFKKTSTFKDDNYYSNKNRPNTNVPPTKMPEKSEIKSIRKTPTFKDDNYYSNKNKPNTNVLPSKSVGKYEELKSNRKTSSFKDDNYYSNKNKPNTNVLPSKLVNERWKRINKQILVSANKPKLEKALPQVSNHVKNKSEDISSSSSKYTSEKSNKTIEKKTTLSNEEEMEWETKDSENLILNKIQNLRNENPKLNNDDSCDFMDWSPCDISKNKLYLVLDTNVLISDLQKIIHLKGKKLKDIGEIIFFIPWRVIQELDVLKQKNNSQLAFKSKKAIDFLFKNFKSSDPHLKGQSALTASKTLMPCDVPDDQILNSCLQIKSEDNWVVLLTNDKNLINKSHMNNIPSFITNDLLKEISETSTLKITYKEICKSEPIDQELYTFENNLKFFIFEVLNSKFRTSLGENWIDLDNFKRINWTLTNIFKIIVEYWNLFSHIFPPEVTTHFKDIVSYFSPETGLSKHLRMERITQASLNFLICLEQFENSKLDNYIKDLIKKYNLTIMDVTTIKNNFDYNKLINPIIIVFADIFNSFHNFCGLISERFDLEPKIPYLNPNEAPTLQDIYNKMQNIPIFIRNIRELINSILSSNSNLDSTNQVINSLYNLLKYYFLPNELTFDLNQLVLFCTSKEIRENLNIFVINLTYFETTISNAQNKIEYNT